MKSMDDFDAEFERLLDAGLIKDAVALSSSSAFRDADFDALRDHVRGAVKDLVQDFGGQASPHAALVVAVAAGRQAQLFAKRQAAIDAAHTRRLAQRVDTTDQLLADQEQRLSGLELRIGDTQRHARLS